LYTTFGNLGAALQFAYPEVTWELERFSVRGKKAGQRWLKVKIEELLPTVEIIEDYLHPELFWGMFSSSFFIPLIPLLNLLEENSDRHVELDLWLPHFRIAIEFQGMSLFGPSARFVLNFRRASLLQCGTCFWTQRHV
jgi:hypothetical protein